MHPFSWTDILLLLVLFLFTFVCLYYIKPIMKQALRWQVTVAMLLLPMWITCIYLYGWLIFDYNLVPFILFISCFVLGLQLYDYIRKIKHFEFKKYYLLASALLFQHLTLFLIGLIVLRFVALIVG